MNASLDPRPTSVEARIESAHRFIAANRLDDAEALLTDVARGAPEHVEALRALGALALARRQPDKASELLSPLATAYPDHAGIVSSLGMAHQMAGRLDQAIVCFERAVALSPDDNAALLSLGTTRFLARDLKGAFEAAQSLVDRAPDEAPALSLLGFVKMVTGEHAEAERYLRRALELSPNDAESLRHLSISYFQRHRLKEAMHFAERAQIAAPLSVDTLEHYARCLAAVGRYSDAETVCRKVLAFAPSHVGVCEILAQILIVSGSPDAGIAELTKVVKARPKDTNALLALAATVRFAGRLERALPFVEHALKFDPAHERAAEIKQEMLLALGRFPQPAETAAERPPLPLRVIVPPQLLAPEFILFARFIPKLATDNGPVKVTADEQFVPIIERLDAATELGSPQETDASIALPALMSMFAVDAPRAGQDVPYLSPSPAAEAKWRQALSEHPRPWIGVLWEKHSLGFSVAQIRTALPTDGSHVSLMAGEARHQLREWPEAVDAGRHLDSFDDLIAAIACLDVVIGPDVAALHVCGALGRPGVVVVPAGYPWYWAAADGKALWYPSVAVVRQDRVGQWERAMQQARDQLAARISNLAG